MNCKRCGARLAQGILICPECGTRQRRQARWVHCAACRNRVPVDRTICPHCGRALRPAGPRWGVWFAGIVLVALAGLWLIDQVPVQRWWQRATSLQDRLVRLVQIPELPSGTDVAAATPAAESVALVPSAFPTMPEGGLPRTQVPPGLAGAGAQAAATEQAPASDTPAPATATAVPTDAPTATPLPPTATPTEPPTATPTAAPTATPLPPTVTRTPDVNRYYTVRSGESLALIGEVTGIDWRLIAAANNITEATMLHPGDKLRLPPATTSQAAGASAAQATATPVRILKYIIQSGDSLAAVGQRYGIPWQDIARANNITQFTMLQPGQEIIIPRPGSTPPTDTPTSKPVAKLAKSTVTPAPNLPGPALVSPADGTPFNGSNAFVELTWRPVDSMPGGAVYRVVVQYVSGGAPQEQSWNTTALGMRVPLALWSLADQPGRQYTWSVTAVLPATDGKGGERLIPLSQPSASRTFTWH